MLLSFLSLTVMLFLFVAIRAFTGDSTIHMFNALTPPLVSHIFLLVLQIDILHNETLFDKYKVVAMSYEVAVVRDTD